jgi:hypothetical protein
MNNHILTSVRAWVASHVCDIDGIYVVQLRHQQ